MLSQLLTLVIGLVVGVIAYRITPRKGPLWIPMLLGVAGSLLGRICFSSVGIYVGGLLPLTIVAIIGALVLVGPYLLRKRVIPRGDNQSKLGESTLPLQATDPTPDVNPKEEIRRPASVSSGGDIFISYATPDRPTAQLLAKAIQDEGWSVWWDRTIPPGKSFDEVIEAALDAAKCVVVLWSKTSVSSNWVKVEAAEAARRKILVPALIADVPIPLEFRRLQAASLVDWPTSEPHLGFQSLVGSIADLLGKPRTSRV